MICSMLLPNMLSCFEDDKELISQGETPGEIGYIIEELSDAFDSVMGSLEDFTKDKDDESDDFFMVLYTGLKAIQHTFNELANDINSNNENFYGIWFEGDYLYKINVMDLSCSRVRFNDGNMKKNNDDKLKGPLIKSALKGFLESLKKNVNLENYRNLNGSDHLYLYVIDFDIICNDAPIAFLDPSFFRC